MAILHDLKNLLFYRACVRWKSRNVKMVYHAFQNWKIFLKIFIFSFLSKFSSAKKVKFGLYCARPKVEFSQIRVFDSFAILPKIEKKTSNRDQNKGVRESAKNPEFSKIGPKNFSRKKWKMTPCVHFHFFKCTKTTKSPILTELSEPSDQAPKSGHFCQNRKMRNLPAT